MTIVGAGLLASATTGAGPRISLAKKASRPRLNPRDREQCVADGHTLLILFTESLGVRLAVRVEEFLAALLPCRFEFGRGDVPVRPAFPGNGT